MDWLRHTRRHRAAIVAMLACAMLAPVLAHATERPAIVGARVYVARSHIVTDIECAHLLSEQIVGTVESGLPAVVELAYRLRNDDHDDVRRGVHSFRLRYDVWDNVYSLERDDSTLAFASFAALQQAAEHLRRVPIAGMEDVLAGGVYSIDLSIAVHALRGGEQREIVGWVDDTVRGSSDGSWREQLLNVNGLIHGFFSRNQGPANHSEWFRTIPFTPASLPPDRAGDGGGGR